jgi:hypothetical protein
VLLELQLVLVELLLADSLLVAVDSSLVVETLQLVKLVVVDSMMV